MCKRPTYQFIKDSFEEVGYTLLSTEYKPNIKLEYICPSGHNHSITWASWKKGTRCFYCSSQVKPTIQDIKILFELEGYKLISKEYKGAHSKLFYTCSKGHDHSIAWHEWKKGQRCGRCKGNIEITFEYIRDCFIREDYKILSYNYINSRDFFDCVCPFGHTYRTHWNTWQQGSRCRICANIKLSGSGNPSWADGASNRGYCPLWKDATYKDSIKERDNNICRNPYCYNDDPKLVIHHIDYDKKNCHPSNLITVCSNCNKRANTNREWHQAWYETLMKKRFNK